MAPDYLALKRSMAAAEADPHVDTGPAAVALVQQWLARHEREMVERRLESPSEFNGTMIQWFHWYGEADGSHWRRLRLEAANLAAAGFTAIWLPPAYKGSGPADVGYGVYDLYDLGEFDQKGTIRTRYGTKDEYLAAVRACRQTGLQVYADVVFNNKIGADSPEDFGATPFDPANRNQRLGDERTIRAWTNFRFEGRQGHYSNLICVFSFHS